jgi:CHRD domain-containing protein
MKRLSIKAAAVVVALFALAMGSYAIASAGSNQEKVRSDRLTGYQETPAISSTGTGSFTARIDDDEQMITFKLTYSGLTAPALVSHIHFGARFTAGGVSAFLCGGGGKPDCPPGTMSKAIVTGTITAADVVGPAGQGITPGEFGELVRAIRSGVTYVNVHTSNFPSGEIRGQVNDQDEREG